MDIDFDELILSGDALDDAKAQFLERFGPDVDQPDGVIFNRYDSGFRPDWGELIFYAGYRILAGYAMGPSVGWITLDKLKEWGRA